MCPLCVHTGLEGERWSHSVPTMRPLLAHYTFQPFWVESMRPLMWQLCAHYATNMGPNRPTMCPPFPDYFYKPFWGWSDGSGVPPRCAHYRAKPFWGLIDGGLGAQSTRPLCAQTAWELKQWSHNAPTM